ncbi:hypothetical protein BXZ70DRAFT_309155 [Cristinia sonorae]|uniref:Uncharacterized protein n=1 Tax=Cristinia sonorae TaxID=1940300 RepID=A0A8K0XNL4_9AGAR|nr:hypothetical protein BXZ70DRAFT_309155 [Cristinia sonorae]
MPSSFSMPSNPVTILTDATNGFRNNVRRMRSRTLWDQPRTMTIGKENQLTNKGITAATPVTADVGKWDPVDGKIIIKVCVPVTDDIWRFKVPEDITLAAFHQKVEAKIGFPVVLGKSQVDTLFSEMQFKQWVGRRVRNGRNTPLTARPAWTDVKKSLR